MITNQNDVKKVRLVLKFHRMCVRTVSAQFPTVPYYFQLFVRTMFISTFSTCKVFDEGRLCEMIFPIVLSMYISTRAYHLSPAKNIQTGSLRERIGTNSML